MRIVTTAPEPTTTQNWQQLDSRHHIHPFTDHAALAERGVRVITRAEGVYLWDSDGNRLLDGMAGLWAVNLGYGRAELAQAGYRQLQELPYYNTFFQTTHPPAVALAEALSRVTPPGLSHAFFANSGSEANDTIVKMVRYYWNLHDRPEKKIIISREHAYHGVTLAAASLSGISTMHPQADLPLPLFEHVDAPYWYDQGGETSPDQFGLDAARSLERKIEELGADRVAAFIGEPIQGAGGVIVPPESYWPEIQRICRAHDVLVIADEVICGFGRTGRWFGCDTFGIAPDFMTLAKGLSSGYLPISAVMIADRVAETLIGAHQEFTHGFTYSGHPVAAAVALENIRILEQERIIETVAETTAPYFQARLREFAEHPLVGEVRGVGLIAAMELVEDKARRKHFDAKREVGVRCRDHSVANGLIMRAVRDIMVLAPPLVISLGEIDELIDRARLALDLTARDLGLD
jgi:putrescine aminotransferase